MLVLALSAIGSVVASLYQQQSDAQAKNDLRTALAKLERSNTTIEATTVEIKSLLISQVTANGVSQKLVQAIEQNGFAPEDLKLVEQSLTAESAVTALAPAAQAKNQGHPTTVLYYAKDVDPGDVNGTVLIGALEQYGFNVRKTTKGERNPNLATNTVWVADHVPNEQWKLVVLTLMRAGVQIRSIQRFRYQSDGSQLKPNTIEIGADPAPQVTNHAPMTVQDILDMKCLPPRQGHDVGCSTEQPSIASHRLSARGRKV